MPMELEAIDIDRYGIGRFGDLRLQKRWSSVIVLWLHHLAHAYWH
jgi:hypothetical protein